MGMYDKFTPDPEIRCPKCAGILEGWQGKPESGPALLEWYQGYKHPIDQGCDEYFKVSKEKLEEFHLPDKFSIWGGSCNECGFVPSHTGYNFYGECINGVWMKTSFEPYSLAADCGENWHECPSCLNIWNTNPNKTHDYCSSCNIFSELQHSPNNTLNLTPKDGAG